MPPTPRVLSRTRPRRLTAATDVVPGAPDRTFYGRAIATALARKRPSLLVETQRQERDARVKWLARDTKVLVEICSEARLRG